MHVLEYRFQLFVAGDLLLQEVFHGFHVVVGGPLNLLDLLRFGLAEIGHNGIQLLMGLFAEGRHFGDVGVFAQALQPAHFHRDAAVNQAKFAENRAQISGFAAVAAINGGNSVQGRELVEGCGCHGSLLLGFKRIGKGGHCTGKWVILRVVWAERNGDGGCGLRPYPP